MNRSQLVAEAAKRAGLEEKAVDAALRGILDVVAGVVARGKDKVTIPGWIGFEQVTRAARKARNPRTGEAIKVAKSKGVRVTAGATLKNIAAGRVPAPGSAKAGAKASGRAAAGKAPAKAAAAKPAAAKRAAKPGAKSPAKAAAAPKATKAAAKSAAVPAKATKPPAKSAAKVPARTAAAPKAAAKPKAAGTAKPRGRAR